MLAPCADLIVEVSDQFIPRRYAAGEIAPEPLSPALFEVADRRALLLHPSEVAEIEHPLAVDVGELDQVIVGDRFEMCAENPRPATAIAKVFCASTPHASTHL